METSHLAHHWIILLRTGLERIIRTFFTLHPEPWFVPFAIWLRSNLLQPFLAWCGWRRTGKRCNCSGFENTNVSVKQCCLASLVVITKVQALLLICRGQWLCIRNDVSWNLDIDVEHVHLSSQGSWALLSSWASDSIHDAAHSVFSLNALFSHFLLVLIQVRMCTKPRRRVWRNLHWCFPQAAWLFSLTLGLITRCLTIIDNMLVLTILRLMRALV